MIIFNGKEFAQKKEKFLKAEFAKLAKKGIRPKLVFILVGKSKEAEFYVSLKEKVAKRLGVEFEIKKFPAKAGIEAIYQYVNFLNQDKKVSGITFEYPLPKKFKKVLPLMIAPEKDVDCLTPFNLGRLVMGDWLVLPSSVRAVLEVLSEACGVTRRLDLNILHTTYYIPNTDLEGKRITIVGFGTLVGRPLSLVLKHLGATVTIGDEFTKDLAYWTRQAEILISATGQPGLIKKNMVKKGAVVIDIGSSRFKVQGSRFKVVGDVKPEVAQIASFFTPVPGGVGPVTIMCLFENLLELMKTDDDLYI